MSKILLTIFLLILICQTTEAQPVMWQKIYSYSQKFIYANDIIQTFEGGYIIAGGMTIPKRVYLIKINPLGVKEWEKIFYDSTNEIDVVAIKQSADSGYVITGTRSQSYYILKTDKDGNFLWRKSYNQGGDASAMDVQLTNDNGYIISGSIFFLSGLSSKTYIVKTDSIGNVEWEKLYGDSTLTSGTIILKDICGNYYFTNSTRTTVSSPLVAMLYKLDMIGNIIWKKLIGINKGGYPFYILGDKLFLGGQPRVNILYLGKFDTTGTKIWENEFSDSISVQNVCTNSNNEFIFGGYKWESNQSNYAATKFDVNGNFVSKKIINTPSTSDDFLTKIRWTSDSGYVLIGTTDYGTMHFQEQNILAVKTDSLFNTSPIVNVNNNLLEMDPQNFKLYQNYPNPFPPVYPSGWYTNLIVEDTAYFTLRPSSNVIVYAPNRITLKYNSNLTFNISAGSIQQIRFKSGSLFCNEGAIIRGPGGTVFFGSDYLSAKNCFNSINSDTNYSSTSRGIAKDLKAIVLKLKPNGDTIWTKYFDAIRGDFILPTNPQYVLYQTEFPLLG